MAIVVSVRGYCCMRAVYLFLDATSTTGSAVCFLRRKKPNWALSRLSVKLSTLLDNIVCDPRSLPSAWAARYALVVTDTVNDIHGHPLHNNKKHHPPACMGNFQMSEKPLIFLL